MARRSVFVLATVHSVQETFGYPCCTQCHGRIHALEDEDTFSCTKCHQEYRAEDVNYRYRICVVASDVTQTSEITVFGSCLDQFFGCSATDFYSIVCCLESDCENHGFSISRLVQQAMEQCFGGRSLQFGFRVAPPCRRASQIERGSPAQLANITSNISSHGTRDCRYTHPNSLSQLTACQIARTSQVDLSPTVLDILTETVRQIWSDSPSGHCSGLPNHTPQCRVNLKGESVAPSNHGSLCRVSGTLHSAWPMSPSPCISGQYCTPKSFSQFLSPMVLTCDSDSSNQPESGSTFNRFCPESQANNHIEVSSSTSPQEYLRPEDVSFQFAPLNMSENKKYTNPKPPHSTLYGSDLMNLDVSESITADPNTEQVFELPSSEDLSAFLADLALDEFCDSSEDGFGLLKARNSSQTTSESKDIARNLVCARLEGSRELGTKSRENAWLSVIPGVNTTWQSETNYTNTTTSSDIKHLLVSEGIRGERDYATQSALIEITEAWQTNSIELPRCGDISATDIVDRESGCLGNTALSVYIPRNSSKSLYSLSSPSLVDILQIEGTTERSICDVSDFPSSEDLEAFLANIESSDFPIEVRQSYLSNVSTGFSDAKNLQRKTGTTNEELHDSSFLQSKPAQSSRFVNTKKVQTTLGEKDIVFWQSPCQTEPNSSASSEISFEVHNSWFVDDSPITNCNDKYSRCSGSHSLGTEGDSINSRRVVEQISQVHLDDLYGHTDGCKCNSETVNSSQFDKKGSSGFKTQHTNAFVANTSELKHQDDICALIDPTTSNAILVNDSSDQSCLFLGSPELFSQSRSLFDNSTSCCNTPLLFTRTSLEEFSGSPEVEDNHRVTSLLLFPSSQSLHEPCSPIHSNTADTKSIKQSVLHHLSHSTPLATNRCTLDSTYANCEGNKQPYLHHLNHSTPLDTSHFGSARVNRVLFSRCSFSSRYRTPVNRRSGICSVGKFSGPTSSVSFTSSLEDELLRYPNTPLLFSISSSSATELNSVLY